MYAEVGVEVGVEASYPEASFELQQGLAFQLGRKGRGVANFCSVHATNTGGTRASQALVHSTLPSSRTME